MTTTPLSELLKARIADDHDRIESLPLSTAIAGGSVSREEYGRLMGQMRHIHAALERALSGLPEAAGVYRPDMARAEVIDRDLENLGVGPGGGDPLPACAGLLRAIGEARKSDRFALLGSLYVLEGSKMGSTYLSRPLARGFGVELTENAGLDYHLAGIGTRGRDWKAFKSALDALPPAAHGPVTEAAAATMTALCELYAQVPEAEPATAA